MASQSTEPEINFKSQPTSFRPRGKNILLKARHGHIKGTGKSKFPKINFKNVCGKRFLVVEPVYEGNKNLRHHYRLVKYDKLKENSPLTVDPLLYKLDGTKKDYTIDLQIAVMPPQDEYKRKGVNKKMMKKFDLNDKKMVLSCKVYLSRQDSKNGVNAIATIYSNPLENLSEKLPDHNIVGEGSVDGGEEIKLPFLRDLPNTSYVVRFSNKREKFTAYGKIENTKSCSNWMYVETPAYILENRKEPEKLTENVKISVHIVRVHDGKLSKEFHFEYTPRKIQIPNFSSAGTSQDEIITIMDMLSMKEDDKMNIWLICTPISLTEEYVNKNIRVRFAENNIEYTDVEIKKFEPEVNKGLLILETPLNFCEKFGKDATIQIYNKRSNTLSEKCKMKFPKSEADNCGEIFKDANFECGPSDLDDWSPSDLDYWSPSDLDDWSPSDLDDLVKIYL